MDVRWITLLHICGWVQVFLTPDAVRSVQNVIRRVLDAIAEDKMPLNVQPDELRAYKAQKTILNLWHQKQRASRQAWSRCVPRRNPHRARCCTADAVALDRGASALGIQV